MFSVISKSMYLTTCIIFQERHCEFFQKKLSFVTGVTAIIPKLVPAGNAQHIRSFKTLLPDNV